MRACAGAVLVGAAGAGAGAGVGVGLGVKVLEKVGWCKCWWVRGENMCVWDGKGGGGKGWRKL